jgi:DNA-nicking Smr family endonuclease
MSGNPPRPRRRRGAITPEEHALWAHVARSAKPLPGRSHPEIAPEPEEPPKPASKPVVPAPAARTTRPPGHALPPLVGIEKRLARGLARGTRPVDARIDLHGKRQAEAHHALHAFIHRAQAQGARIVLVITGKGGSDMPGPFGEERGVLRRMVPHWLAESSLRRVVLGFERAARGHGGEGALYVRLRKAGREA